jgi:hypothetical protein
MSGLEVLGIVANVIQIADVGGRLSVKLCAFSHKVKHADANIRAISNDVSLTCNVLRELGDNLKKDEQRGLCSNNAVATAERVMKECMKVFVELEAALDGKGVDVDGGKGVFKRIGRGLKFSMVEPQIELLRSNLERLKSTLLLMLNVIIYAEQLRRYVSNCGYMIWPFNCFTAKRKCRSYRSSRSSSRF